MTDFVISISYGNYLIQNGGTDKVIREHQNLFAECDIDYVFLFPVVRTIKMGRFSKTYRFWGVNKNKELVGLYKLESVINYIDSQLYGKNKCRGIFIHHTWRVLDEDLKAILDLIEAPIYYYLHDFHSICDGNNLVNQTGDYCGYGLTHLMCNKECIYYEQSQDNRIGLLSLIRRYEQRLTFVAPSDNTRDIYKRTFEEYSDKFITIEHQKMVGEYDKKSFGKPVKIAFIGKQISLKGWEDYKELIKDVGNSSEFEFYYLGTGSDVPANVKAVEVSVREQGSDAMMNALRSQGIDVVLLLSHWPETYSYTYFEAYAAGCFVITYACSGNMADMVKKNHNGIVVDDKEQLLLQLHDSGILTKCIIDFFTRHPHFPLALEANDEIARTVLKKEIQVGANDSHGFCIKRQLLAEALYRFQNRNALHKLSKR